jgi:hypothetical protein
MEIAKKKTDMYIKYIFLFAIDFNNKKIPKARKKRDKLDSRTILEEIMCHGEDIKIMLENIDINLFLVNSKVINPIIIVVKNPKMIEGRRGVRLLLLNMEKNGAKI